MRAARLCLALATAASVTLAAAPAASADTAVQQGWWTVTNPGGLPAAVPAQPDVPSDGLFVQGGPAGMAAATSAVIYDVPGGTLPNKLSLQTAGTASAQSTATLEVCALMNAEFTVEQGGPSADAPPYDSTRCSTAAIDTGGAAFTFDVHALSQGGILALAILPMAASDRVAFAKPTASDLSTTTVFSPAPATSGGDSSTGGASAQPSASATATASASTAPVTQGASNTPANTGHSSTSVVPTTVQAGSQPASTAVAPAAATGTVAAVGAPDAASSAAPAGSDSSDALATSDTNTTDTTSDTTTDSTGTATDSSTAGAATSDAAPTTTVASTAKAKGSSDVGLVFLVLLVLVGGVLWVFAGRDRVDVVAPGEPD